MVIQYILIVSIIFAGAYFLGKRNAMQVRAWKRILLFIFMLTAAASVLYPSILTAVANFVGVGRGADLLLYGLIVVFAFVVLNIYLKFKEQQETTVKLARKLALFERSLEEKQ